MWGDSSKSQQEGLQKLKLILPCTSIILKDNPKNDMEMQEIKNLVKIILTQVRESIPHNFKTYHSAKIREYSVGIKTIV